MRFSFVTRLSLLALTGTVLVPFAHAQDASDSTYQYFYLSDASITQSLSPASVKIGKDINGNNYGTTDADKITVTVNSPGSYGNMTAYNKNVLNIVSGTLQQAYADNAATVNISGGTIDIVNPFTSTSTINISGGSLRNLQMYGGTSNVTGGTVGKASLSTGVLNLYGGNIGGVGPIFLSGQGVLNIYGTNLSIASSQSQSGYTDYVLSGMLQNGQSVNGLTVRDSSGGYEYNDGTQSGTPSSFNLITANAAAAPEPGSIALSLTVGVPVLGVIIRRRRK